MQARDPNPKHALIAATIMAVLLFGGILALAVWAMWVLLSG